MAEKNYDRTYVIDVSIQLELSAEHEKGVELFFIYSLGLLPDSDQKTVTQILLIEHQHRVKVGALAEEYRGINV